MDKKCTWNIFIELFLHLFATLLNLSYLMLETNYLISALGVSVLMVVGEEVGTMSSLR